MSGYFAERRGFQGRRSSYGASPRGVAESLDVPPRLCVTDTRSTNS